MQIKPGDNIQQKLNEASYGERCELADGTYGVSSPIIMPAGRRIVGTRAARIVGANASVMMFKVHADDVVFDGVTLVGKAIFCDKPGGIMVGQLVVNSCRFEVRAAGEHWNGITFTTGLRNSRITNNTFDPINGDNGIYGYNWDNLVIANNEFYNGNEGIHLIAHWDPSPNLLIEQNYFSGLRRMGIEIQGGGRNTIVQDNHDEKPAMTARFEDNLSTFAYSIIADRSVGTRIRRNTAICPERPDGTGVRIVFEVGGDDCLVEENYVVGGNHVLAANDGTGTTSVLARRNKWEGFRIGPSGRGLTLAGGDDANGPQAPLSWSIMRGRPRPNQRFGDATPGPQPPPDPQPSDGYPAELAVTLPGREPVWYARKREVK
jgi:hypothetical protein